MTREMKKLRDMLTKSDIYWWDDSDRGYLDIDRTKFVYNDIQYSVIHGHGTFGGYNLFDKDEGLLEMMAGNNEPIGYLTALDVMSYVTGLRRTI